MNQRLAEVVNAHKPDLLFACIFSEELKRKTIRAISEQTDTITLNWFTDDHWRFDRYSRYWAPQFNYVVTTAQSAVPKYERIGYRGAIKSQWAANPFIYRKLDLPVKYDLTFVGQPHGNRREIITALRDAGLEVQAWGNGWEAGRISQEKMIEVFNQSRINLNLANASVENLSRWQSTRRLARRVAGAALRRMPKAAHWLRGGNSTQSISPVATAAPARTSVPPTYASQIKGRNFEIPGCGGFTLSDPADNLQTYYEPGREIAVFQGISDLIEKARYYLDHESDRDATAKAGHARTLAEHTYVHRFNDILKRLGLPAQPGNYGTDFTPAPGAVEEIQ
jgi:spore maturation protein CgeB